MTMTEHKTRSGHCLCGRVRVSLRCGDEVDACHCSICRRWGGGPLLAIEPEGDVKFDGVEQIAVFESSDWAERGFCRRCGTHLFYRLKEPVHYAIPVGLLDDPGALRLAKEIFVDEQPQAYAFAGERPRLTGAEVFEQFQASMRDEGQDST
jgi:hypothetical protein